MFISFFNPQGNFDPDDSYWMEHPDFGGQLVYVKETALALAELGHWVDIVTRQIKDSEWPEFSEQIDSYPESEGVRIVRIPCGPDEFLPKEQLWPHLGTDWLEGIIEFYEEEGEFPDITSTHYGDGGLVGALFKKRTGTNYTFTGHSLGAQKMERLGVSRENISEVDEKYHFARRIAAERVAMNRASRVITSTNQERFNQYGHRVYRDAISVERDPKFSVIPPGVNRKIFNEEKTVQDERIEGRIKSALQRDIPNERRDLPLVICSSRLDRKKNHLGLVNSFVTSNPLRETANLALVVRGAEDPFHQRDNYDGEGRAILDDIASILDNHGLWGTVTSFPLDNQEELAAAYRWASERSSVFALTSVYEPFGLAPLEAMSCGLPAVATNQGGPTESLVDEETGNEYGVLVDPEDPEDIAKGLLELLTSKENWERHRTDGLNRVLSRYTWKQTAKSYAETLKNVKDGSGPNGDRIPIPDYYTNPTSETGVELDKLKKLYFNENSRTEDSV